VARAYARQSNLTVSQQVVDRFSSTIEHGREIVGIIPADHEHMTKFSGPLDVGFIRIAGALIRWFDDITSRQASITAGNEPGIGEVSSFL